MLCSLIRKQVAEPTGTILHTGKQTVQLLRRLGYQLPSTRGQWDNALVHDLNPPQTFMSLYPLLMTNRSSPTLQHST